MSDSPFRAGFGKTPPVLAGREELLHGFETAIEAGQWGQERATLITGFRGVGKTVAVNALEDIARRRGWAVISETATPGFVQRLVGTHLPRLLNDLVPSGGPRITNVTTSLGGFSLEYTDGRTIIETFRSMAVQICEVLDSRGAGLLVTLDEISEHSGEDMRLFAADFQHLIRADMEVAFVGAGLRTGISALLEDRSLTFLRRSAPAVLDLLSYEEAAHALADPIRGAGRVIDDDDLAYATSASQGYPFLVQLIGDLAWKVTPESSHIDRDAVASAYVKARRSMGAYILEPSLADLSNIDKTVLAAMAFDDDLSKIADIRQRLGIDSQYMNVYRQRLLDAGVVFSPGYGRLGIAIPYLREYLREHVVADAASRTFERREDFPPPPPLP